MGGERVGVLITDDEITSLTPLIKYLVLKTVGRVDDDLVQEAFIGVLKAKETFDPSRGRTWPTWAAYKAEKAILDYIRKTNHSRTKQKLEFCSFENLEKVISDDVSFEDESVRLLDQEYLAKIISEVLKSQHPNRRIRMYLLSLGFNKGQAAELTNSHPTMTSADLRAMRKDARLVNIL